MKKIDLSKVVSIANIVSSIALIISIIILITEYKRAEVIDEKTIENLVYDRMMELDRLIIENPDLAAIVSKANTSTDSLSVSDRLRYLAYEHIFYDSWETLWVGYNNGVVTKNTWNDWNNWFKREFKKKPELSREGNIENFSNDFLEFIKSDVK